MVEAGADLDRALPGGAVLVGNWATAVLIGSRHRAVPLMDWANSDDPIGRFGATHLVTVVEGFDYKLFNERYPDLLADSKVFRQYYVRGTPLIVYELPKRDNEPPPGP